MEAYHKRFCLILILLLSLSHARAQIGTTTNSTNRNEVDYNLNSLYNSEQAIDFYESEVKANSSNQSAWMNLYELKRKTFFPEHSRALESKEKKELNDLVQRMSEEVPGTFAYEYCAYVNGEKSNASLQHLKRAAQLNGSYAELQDELLFLSIIENSGKQKEYATSLANTNKYTAVEKEYNRNVLNSVEAGGVLITYGNVDTYPILIEQWKNGYRTDVKVVCIEWLGNETFCTQTEQLLGLKKGALSGSEKEKFNALLTANSTSAIYAALTLPPSFFSPVSSKLYCTGLAFKYSEKPLANSGSLQYNWENLFQKNYLSSSEAITKNYLVPLVLLEKLYKSQNRNSDSDKVKQQALQIGERFGLNKTVNQYID